MSQTSVMVSLPQMVDLALNNPEVGVVNFNILHSLLHVLIQQVNLTDCKVEFRGGNSDRVQGLMNTVKPGPSLNLTEYQIVPGEDNKKVVSQKSKQKGKKGDNEAGEQLNVGGEDNEVETIVVVEPTEDAGGSHHGFVPIHTHVETLQQEIQKMKEDIEELKGLPKNTGLLDALRNSTSNTSPVVDMFQILSLTKRIDATETAITKLASIVEDVAREGTGSQGVGSVIAVLGGPVKPAAIVSEETSGAEAQQPKPSSAAADSNTSVNAVTKTTSSGKAGAAKKGSKKGDADNESQGSGVSEEKAKQKKGDGAVGKMQSSSPAGARPAALNQDLSDVITRLGILENRLKMIEEGISGTKEDAKGSPITSSTDLTKRFDELETKFSECAEQVSTLDTIFNNQVNMLQTQFIDLEKEIGEVIERINVGLPAGDTGAEQKAELYSKIIQMQEDIEHMTITTNKLIEDKEEKEASMDALLEQIELLKTIKANREDLEDALADKADTCAVNRKVSHDQFDAACDDLTRNIEEALTKLQQQEQLWQQALDDIQREIENKLDKMELTPLRDFVHSKLKMLQEKLKAVAALKKETEAAGTKSKFLRNVNCISCDQDVIMRKHMDTTLMPPPPSLPPTKSMGPYLAYELDMLRKQQKCVPHSRNMNHFENAMAGYKSKGDEDHICNRYCGGSHTVTTPQQRVARLGHFLQQWGPDTQAVIEGQIRGTDGQFYKSREGGDAENDKRPLASVQEETFVDSPNMKNRPSMVVQGDIIAMRNQLKRYAQAAKK